MNGGWDCHAHLFGPYARFPLAADRSYTPPEATEAAYLALLQRLGLDHGVLVHPSAYGDDFGLLFHALATYPQLRGVLVLRHDTPLDLAGLRAQGVRALRFSHRSAAGANFAGSASLQFSTGSRPGRFRPTRGCTPNCGPTTWRCPGSPPPCAPCRCRWSSTTWAVLM